MQPIPEGSTAKCSRCGAVLYQNKRNSLGRALMLTIAALILFVLSSAYPVLYFKLHGRVQASTLLTGVREMFSAGMWSLSVLVFLASILMPLLKITGLLYVLLPLKLDRKPPGAALWHRLIKSLQPWGMLEVYLLGALVAIIKLSSLADVKLGLGFYFFGALVLVTTAAAASLDHRVIWEKLEAER